MRLIDGDKFEVFGFTVPPEYKGEQDAYSAGVDYVLNKIDESETVIGGENVCFLPCNIGDKLYSRGHKNRKTPREWEVQFIGYNGTDFFFTLVNYENGEFRESVRITQKEIGSMYFKERGEVVI